VPELARTGGGFAVDRLGAFAEALGRLEDDAVARTMGERGRRAAAAEYSADRMVERYRDLYREAQGAS
jgi:glycosyltransferase involved in cell wall biosynthesis